MTSDIKPFSPDEAKANKVHTLPVQLIQAINELLSEKYTDGGTIRITLKDLKARCRRVFGQDGMSSNADPISSWPDSVWDFEPVYRQQGWSVMYDKPAYNESYDGFYAFKRKRD